METKFSNSQELHKYVLALAGVLFLFGISFPIAYWRVSQSEKFAGTPYKSDSVTNIEENQPSQTIAIVPAANNNQESSVAAISLTPVTQEIVTEEITDPVQIKELNQKVYARIAQLWQGGRSLKQHLAYQVIVTPDGAIASYKPLIAAAETYLPETPLPKLLQSSLPHGTNNQVKAAANTAIGKFKVVFTRQGILQVSPWHGWKR
ncbi:hypothetical protein ACE1CI_30690 [Aerosakkonemataceae cyanobacterium BLCC-F50]|uniref:Uncharacterized protein n=1 Tax=Floridaenema flaviceps BLCC-F50 TaxID=3153642 RepID=A0ABV4Y053_9CYAN